MAFFIFYTITIVISVYFIRAYHKYDKHSLPLIFYFILLIPFFNIVFSAVFLIAEASDHGAFEGYADKVKNLIVKGKWEKD